MPINIGQPFKRTSAGPIDMSLTLTKAEMLAVKDSEMPAKYFTICQDDGQVYLYDKSATPSAQTGKFKLLEAGGTESVELTQAEYDALSDDEKMNGTIYFITDGEGGGGGAEIRTYMLDEPFDYQEVSDTVSSGKQVRFIDVAGNIIEATFIRTDAEGIYFTGYETNYTYSIIARDGQTTWEESQELLMGVSGGGSTGQILAKKSNQTGDTEWVDQPIIVGSDWGVAKTGSANVPVSYEETAEVTVDISDMNFQSSNDFKIAITGMDNYIFCVPTISATSFKIRRVGASTSSNTWVHYTIFAKGYGGKTIPYSTNEQEVGKWIDGKKLYQKTCVYEQTGGVLTANEWTSLNVPNLPTNIETQVDIEISNGAAGHLPIAAGVTNGVIRYFTNAPYGYDKLYFTIKYTKTGGA